jgi:hypothetical protein
MHNDGNSRASSGDTPEDSRLAAVGVDNFGATLTKQSFKAMQCEIILERMDRADKARFEAQEARNRADLRFEGPLRAEGWTRNEPHLHPGLLPQAKHRGNCVFLGAANDQPGNDMSNPHCGVKTNLPSNPASWK